MSKEAMKLALDVLKDSQDYKMGRVMTVEAVEVLEEALAKQEQGEPLCTAAMFDDAFLAKSGLSPDTKLYTTPYVATQRQQRKPLTDEHIKKVWGIHDDDDDPTNIVYERDITRAIEAAHGIGEKE
jgi:hypothetical protein